MREVIVTYGQTLTDIAIQEYGCAEGAFILVQDNPSVNMDGMLIPGFTLLVREDIPQLTPDNAINLKRIKEINLRPATGDGTVQQNSYVDDDYVDDDYVE